jgi:hypothetical protein
MNDDDLTLPMLEAILAELMRRPEGDIPQDNVPDDLDAFKRQLDELLDELCSIARRRKPS